MPTETDGSTKDPGGSGGGGGLTSPVGVADGGTGATNATTARSNLGAAASTHTHIIGDVTGLQTVLDGKASTSHNHAASAINSGQLALAQGGTGADLSATGGTGHVLKQSSAGGVVSVGSITAADLGLTTNGDLLTVIGGVLARLGLGSALQILRVNAAGNGLEFVAPGGGIVGVSEKTADYTLLTADKDWLIAMNSSSNRQITVNGSLDLPAGGMIHFSRAGTGEVTIAASGATVNSPGGLRLRAQHSMATLVCVAADTYLLAGDTKV